MNITLEQVVESIKPPFVAIKDAHGVVTDLVTIALKCDKAHIHKYYVTDILQGGLKCKTCGLKNKFACEVRNLMENIFGVPFILIEAKSIVFANPIICVMIICGEKVEFKNYTIIHLPKKVRNVKRELYEQLEPMMGQFSEKVQEKIKALCSIQRMREMRGPKILNMPFASAFSGLGGPTVEETTGPDLSTLCIENCLGVPEAHEYEHGQGDNKNDKDKDEQH